MSNRNPGYLCRTTDGRKCIRRHNDQEPQFEAVKKSFVHWVDDDFHPILNEDGKEKTGLIDTNKLHVMGCVD